MVTPLVNDLAELVCKLNLPSGERQRRIRLAVSPKEYEEIRRYMLDTYGEFFASIMGIKLVLVEEPLTDAVSVEWAA
jgi:hypothetical protein